MIAMSYRVLVVGEGKYFGLSTSCLFVNVGGENGESGVVAVPRGSYQVEFTCRNLGFLTCVRLSHDNSGLVRSLLVEMVLVYCITTGQTYRFHCGRYFARAEDDGGIDRFIVGEKVSRKLKGSVSMIALGVDDLLPSTGVLRWNRSPKKDTAEKPMESEVKAFVTNSVAKLIAVCQDSSKETLRGKLLPVLYGPNGFVKAMESAFQFGFKCTRKFQKSLFIWDLIERAVPTTTSVLKGDDSGADDNMDDSIVSVISSLTGSTEVDQTFVNVVSSINKFGGAGKDEKAMLFFLLGLRDHHLSLWIRILADSPSTQAVYEPGSFLRDPELLSFLLNCLMLTHSVSIVLEPLLVQGL